MDEETGIRIIDRRRFDSQGKERGDEEQQIVNHEPEKATEKNEVNMDDADGISFSSLIMSLATQTLMQLGEMDSQSGLAVPVDLDGAKQTIEILGMLQKKTKGNLSKEEDQLLEEVLHNLKLGFVKVAQRKP